MPITLKTDVLKYKDPSTGQYGAIDAITDKSTEERIAEINAAGTTQVSAVNTAGTNQINSLNARGNELKNVIIAPTRVSDDDGLGIIVEAGTETATEQRMQEVAASETAAWLDEHIDTTTGYVVDDTLTISGAAADAKKTGDEVSQLKSAISEPTRNLFDWMNYTSPNSSVVVENGVLRNVKTDTRATATLGIIARKNGATVLNIFGTTVTASTKKITFTLPSDADSIRIIEVGQAVDLYADFTVNLPAGTYTISLAIQSADPTTLGGWVIKDIQIEDGSSATKYIPHTSATDYELREQMQNIPAEVAARVIANLVDKNTIISGYLGTTRIESSANAKLCCTRLTEGKKYVFVPTIFDSLYFQTACAAGTQLYSNITNKVIYSNGGDIMQQQADLMFPYVFTVQSGYPYFVVFYYHANETSYTEQQLLNSFYICEYDAFMDGIAKTAHATGGMNPIYDVFTDEIADVSDEITAKTTSKGLLFGIITDTHIDATNDKFNKVAAANMRGVNDNVSFDIVANLGDVINGGGEKAAEREYMRHGIKNILSVGGKKTIAVVGNHDNNGLAASDKHFDDTDLYGMMLRMSETEFVRDGYYDNAYIDYPDMGLRVIFVDSVYNAAGFSTETIEWLTDVLENTPAEYKFVFLSHEPTRYSLISTASGSMDNGDEMEALLATYVDRICGWIHGHTHFDNVSYVTTFPQISITCGQPYQMPSTNFPSGASAPAREIGTVTQDAWDAVLVLPDEDKFEFVRFGAGTSRTVPFRQ